MNTPQASTTVDKKGKLIKWARCPVSTHVDAKGLGSRTSDLLGVQQDFEGEKFWAFRCKAGGKPFHVFLAIPDPDVPARMGDYAEWAAAKQAEQDRKKREGKYLA